jgi:hypothetical protein
MSAVAGWVLAIDFGTSYTTVAIAEGGRVELIDVDGVRAVPSGVWLDPDGALVVGMSAERQARLAPERWERAPKRFLGEVAPLLLGGRRIAVVDAVAAVLRHAAAEAIRRQGHPPDEVRLTYPARWGERRRGALEAAAGLAGLGVPVVAAPPRLVPEPVAAALYFADRGQLPAGAQAAVYDLGGGTFDTAVLAADGQGYTVRALGGLDGVGGESFDALLYAHVGGQLAARDETVWKSLQHPPDARWRRAGEDLYREVRRAKEDLSKYPSVTLDTESLVGVPMQLTRDELETVLRPRIEATARELADTISRSGQRPSDLAAVYLAGGSSRIPLVERVVSDRLQVAAKVLGEPKSVVAAGAARWTPGVRVAIPQPPTEPHPAPLPDPGPGGPVYPQDEAPQYEAQTRIVEVVPDPRRPPWIPPAPSPQPQPQPQPQPRPGSRPWWASPVAMIAAVVIVLGAGVGIAIAANKGSGGGGGGRGASASPSARDTPSPSPSVDPSSPTTAEAALISSLGSIAHDCVPARSAEGADITAAVTCDPAAATSDDTLAVTPHTLGAYQFANLAALAGDVTSSTTALPTAGDSCPAGVTGVGQWEFKGETTPRGACYNKFLSDGDSVFAWYFDSSCVKLAVRGGSSDLAGLHHWWTESGHSSTDSLKSSTSGC